MIIIFFTLSCKENKIKKTVVTTPVIVNKNKKINLKKTNIHPNKDTLNAKNAVAFFTEYGKQNKETKVIFKTRLGNIKIRLYQNTPLHRANFIFLTKKGYFNTTCFHRVVPGFIAQGGDSENRTTSNFRNKYKHYELPPEFRKNRKHKRGSIAAARDWEYNPKKNTTPFEFYFVVNPRGEHHLDFEHTVFGEVFAGMHIIDKITKLRTDDDQWPVIDVEITAEVLK